MKVAIYTRVSTLHQIDKDSLPLQRQDLINYCQYVLNTKDYEIFEDAGYSGKNTDRPAFKQMMTRIKNNEFKYLLVWKIDRISRNLIDFCNMYSELKEHGCTFISKNEQFDTSSAMGEAMLKIILVFAELERKMTGERVKAVMMDRATKGKWNGAPIPLGYKWNDEKKFIEIDPAEAETIKLIFSLYSNEESTSVVRNYLNSNGISTKKGATWTTKTVGDIIHNTIYKGTLRYNYRESGHGKKKDKSEWIFADNKDLQIVSEDIWNKCNNIISTNASKISAKFRSNYIPHIFGDVLYCGHCGSVMHNKLDKARQDGFRPSMHICKNRYNQLGCKQKIINELYIGDFVFNIIRNIAGIDKRRLLNENNIESIVLNNTYDGSVRLDKGSIEELLSILKVSANKNYSANIKDTTKASSTLKLDTEKKKFERALQRLNNLYLFDDDVMSEKDYILKKKELEEKLNAVNEKLKASNSVEGAIDLSSFKNAKLQVYLNNNIDYRNMIASIGREPLKQFVNMIIDKIVILDKNVKSIRFKNGLELNFLYEE